MKYFFIFLGLALVAFLIAIYRKGTVLQAVTPGFAGGTFPKISEITGENAVGTVDLQLASTIGDVHVNRMQIDLFKRSKKIGTLVAKDFDIKNGSNNITTFDATWYQDNIVAVLVDSLFGAGWKDVKYETKVKIFGFVPLASKGVLIA